jgi:hypothetical protein
MEGQGK